MSNNSKGQFSGRTRNIARHFKPSKLSVNHHIKSFEIGDTVAIVPKSNNRDAPHPRYRGRVGKIIDRRGMAYVVEIRQFRTVKELVIPALHLEKV
ncbi:MAG: hypothetical protein M1500_03845 [Candidatus Marsarchaeota archaeon]|nr:hypothetical protein [Candidatus Marsarchaeota archaeon]MCL5112808.1 hypothetical protein [Candidatus Marsarchaeota archaeon]